jgi:hypothetical protein
MAVTASREREEAPDSNTSSSKQNKEKGDLCPEGKQISERRSCPPWKDLTF